MHDKPKAMMSFSRTDDTYEQGRLTQLRDALSAALRFQTGEDFLIFQPHQDIQWGQRPQDRIRAALEHVYLFIVVITPGYFTDSRCRDELMLFLERERRLGGDDLILPIRYLPTPRLENPGADVLAQALVGREMADWTALRRMRLDTPEVQSAIEQMATHVTAALRRVPPPPPLVGEQRFQTDLLPRHLLRLMEIEKQLVRQPADINLQIEREQMVTAINQSASDLGLGPFPQDIVVLMQVTGLLASYSTFLEHQRQMLSDYQRHLRQQEIRASSVERVNLQLRLQDIAQRLDAIEQQQAVLIRAAPRPDAPSMLLGDTRAEQSIVESGGRVSRPMLPLAEVYRLLACADAVAQVRVGQVVRGILKPGRATGTAWLIAPNLALTCWHVLHARGDTDPPAQAYDVDVQAHNCLLTFNFTEIGIGIEYGVERIECADRCTSGLDYALLRVQDRSDHPLRQRTPLPLDIHAPLTVISELYIIQHPRGLQQHGADGLYVMSLNQNMSLKYTVNTAQGTSGAPVLLRPHWRVVALHHGATEDMQYGEGIAIGPILDDIQRQRPDLFHEIVHVQPDDG